MWTVSWIVRATNILEHLLLSTANLTLTATLWNSCFLSYASDKDIEAQRNFYSSSVQWYSGCYMNTSCLLTVCSLFHSSLCSISPFSSTVRKADFSKFYLLNLVSFCPSFAPCISGPSFSCDWPSPVLSYSDSFFTESTWDFCMH